MSDKVHYRGAQWDVTDYGIEQCGYYQENGQWRDGWYFIPTAHLRMSLGKTDWVGHMSEKTWVDVEDFKRAFEVAKRLNT